MDLPSARTLRYRLGHGHQVMAILVGVLFTTLVDIPPDRSTAPDGRLDTALILCEGQVNSSACNRRQDTVSGHLSESEDILQQLGRLHPGRQA